MAQAATAEARGRSMIRPWRVGVLVDVDAADEVRSAMASLSRVWGGQFMPILDLKRSVSEIERAGRLFDVDCVYADINQGELDDFMRRPGWGWPGRGTYGPFGDRGRFEKGLLPVASLSGALTDLVLPRWDRHSDADLAWSAIWGLPDGLGMSDEAMTKRGADILGAISLLSKPGIKVGAIAATASDVRPMVPYDLDGQFGVYVIRPDAPRDGVEFWNRRSFGIPIHGVPANASREIGEAVVIAAAERMAAFSESQSANDLKYLNVWGISHATEALSAAIRSAASDAGLEIHSNDDIGDWPRHVFQGVETPFSQTVRSDFRANAAWIEVAVPKLPLIVDHDAFNRGVVAADIELHSVDGQDPRFTSVLPPFRRHSEFMKSAAMAVSGAHHVRAHTNGQAVGIDAKYDRAPYSFGYSLDVFAKLFDDDSIVRQSDVGKFQSRAAEKFGGPFSGFFNISGVRDAVLLAANDREGVALDYLRKTIENGYSERRDPVWQQMEPKEYARFELNRLLSTGILVPVTRVHCSHCRVERWVSADELSAVMKCEFCQDEFVLALSHSLTPPKWRYRIAAHLRPRQVQALLPALAVTSVLAQFRHIESPLLPHLLGMEVEKNREKLEADVALWIPGPEWLVVLGEVKSANRIDDNDVANIEDLQRRLRAKDVRSMSIFATLKGQFGEQEVAILRSRVERSEFVRTPYGDSVLDMPMVLTGPDLSHHPLARDHPWQWQDQYRGIRGTAIASCERNLGLKNWTYAGGALHCEWDARASVVDAFE